MQLAATASATSSVGLFLAFALLPVLWATCEGLSPRGILLLTLSPTVSDLLQLFHSRRREFLADAGAAELTGDPRALAQALRRIEAIQGDEWERLASRGALRNLRAAWEYHLKDQTMSLRRDLAVFRQAGFYISALMVFLAPAGLLVFCGLAAP
jgi:Zn-dependent protease with chaperone function